MGANCKLQNPTSLYERELLLKTLLSFFTVTYRRHTSTPIMEENLYWKLLITSIVLAITQPTLCHEHCIEEFANKEAYCEGGLTSIPQDLQTDLVGLSVMRCDLITTLHNDSFVRYPKLTELILSENNISAIESGAFLPLTHLSKLVLSNNSMLTRMQGALGELPAIHFQANYCNLNSSLRGNFLELSLVGNQITRVNVTCGNRNFSCDNINLEGNKIRHITGKTFVINCNATFMTLHNNPIELIDPSLIASLKVRHLKIGGWSIPLEHISNLFLGVKDSVIISHLELRAVGLETISPGFFSHLSGKPLAKFDLIGNKFRNLSEHAFSNLSSVQALTLNSNGIEINNPMHYNGMNALRVLSMENDIISIINKGNNAWNLNLTELNLRKNFIDKIDRYSFQNLTTLKILDLSENVFLESIENGTFSDCLMLESLDLSDTHIYYFHQGLDPGLPSLKSLIIRSPSMFTMLDDLLRPGQLGLQVPSLERLDLYGSSYDIEALWDPVKNISAFHGLYKLQYLILSYNGGQDVIRMQLFKNLSNLIELRLSMCDILEINNEHFVELRNLRVLDLAANEIQVLHPTVINGMPNLEYLYLEENHITFLAEDVFIRNINLQGLCLTSNILSSLNYGTFRTLVPTLQLLDLGDNPLVCNCELEWMYYWLRNGPLKLQNKHDTICAMTSETPFRGKQLIMFDPREECISNILFYYFLVPGGIAFLLMLILIYYNRWLIRNKLFLLKLYVKGYEEILDDEERREFPYDLNIVFHSVDEAWVNEHLRRSLEERLPDFNRISCGDDDLMLGMYYLDAVNYAVENSFKVIMVVSRAAVQDHWFMLKFRTALDHVNDTGTEKMTLIFLEDIPRDELPFLLRVFLGDKRPYLIWTDDNRGQIYFLEELVKNLTVNIKRNHVIPP